jgi:hypothetical protein
MFFEVISNDLIILLVDLETRAHDRDLEPRRGIVCANRILCGPALVVADNQELHLSDFACFATRDFALVNGYPQQGVRSGEVVREVFVKEHCSLVIFVNVFDPVVGLIQDVEDEFIWES